MFRKISELQREAQSYYLDISPRQRLMTCFPVLHKVRFKAFLCGGSPAYFTREDFLYGTGYGLKICGAVGQLHNNFSEDNAGFVEDDTGDEIAVGAIIRIEACEVWDIMWSVEITDGEDGEREWSAKKV